MRKNGPISMPFARSNEDAPTKVIEMARRAQSAVYDNFNVRRNSRRVDRFFILLRASRAERAIAIVWGVAILVIICVELSLMRTFYISGTARKRDEIARSVFNTVRLEMTFLMDEPRVISEIIGRIYANEEIPKKSTAADVAWRLVKAFQSSSKTITCMNVGVNDGTYIGVVSVGGNLSWLFSEMTQTQAGYLQIWETNEQGIAEGYPYTEGVQLNVLMNATAADWYQQGRTFQQTEWGKLYFDKVTDHPIVAATTPVKDPDWEQELLFVVALEMGLDTIQGVLDSQWSDEYSRLAVTSDAGFLVAVTGSGNTGVDGGVIVKSLDQLGDPVWACVATDSRFGKENFTVQCEIGGQTITYSVFDSVVTRASGGTADWHLHGALRMNPAVHDRVGDPRFIIIPVVVYLIGLGVGICGYRLINFMRIQQSRILFSKTKKEMAFQTEQIGVGKALDIIRKTDLPSYDNPVISTEVREIVDDLQDMSNLYCDGNLFLEQIHNERVRTKMMKKYNIKPVKGLETIPKHVGDESPRSESISAETETEMGSVLQSRNIGNSQLNSTYVTEVLCDACSDWSPFHRHKLERFITGLVEGISPGDVPFLIDSFSFCQQVLSSKAQKFLYEEDMCFSLLFSVLTFHVYMKDRTDEETPLLARYFVMDQAAYTSLSNSLLVELHRCVKHKKAAREEWRSIVSYVRLLADCVLVKHHFECVFKCTYAFAAHCRNEPETKIDVMRLVFCASTISFMFDKPDVVYRANCMLNNSPDFTEQGRLLGCMDQEYLSRMFLGLRQLTGSRFLSIINGVCM